MALSAWALSAHAGELAWDGVTSVPAYAIPETVNRYGVCSPGFQLRYDTALRLDTKACYAGAVFVDARAPTPMSLQDALDLHFKAPTGWRAIAQGPLHVYGSNGWQGPDKREVGIAYKLVRASPQ